MLTIFTNHLWQLAGERRVVDEHIDQMLTETPSVPSELSTVSDRNISGLEADAIARKIMNSKNFYESRGSLGGNSLSELPLGNLNTNRNDVISNMRTNLPIPNNENTSNPDNCNCNCVNRLLANGSVTKSLQTNSSITSSSQCGIYILLICLIFCCGTLAIIFYTHVTNDNDLELFHQNFQNELLINKHLLQTMIAKMIKDNQLQVDTLNRHYFYGTTRNESTTLPSNVEKNEQKLPVTYLRRKRRDLSSGFLDPRGRLGKAGTHGTPGKPDINAWKVKINDTYLSKPLYPLSTTDLSNVTRTIIVEEGTNLRLSCAANGSILHNVEWRRLDGKTITMEREEMSSVSGHTLDISNITRNHMAEYGCFANNGISLVDNATFLIEVHFSPKITVYRLVVSAFEGGAATLECEVDAFPEPIRYWKRASDGKLLDPGEKYQIDSYHNGYKTTLRLTLNNLNNMDFGQYFCVAKNELNTTMASFEIISV